MEVKKTVLLVMKIYGALGTHPVPTGASMTIEQIPVVKKDACLLSQSAKLK